MVQNDKNIIKIKKIIYKRQGINDKSSEAID